MKKTLNPSRQDNLYFIKVENRNPSQCRDRKCDWIHPLFFFQSMGLLYASNPSFYNKKLPYIIKTRKRSSQCLQRLYCSRHRLEKVKITGLYGFLLTRNWANIFLSWLQQASVVNTKIYFALKPCLSHMSYLNDWWRWI